MRSRKSELIVAAGLGIGGFILGFISAKLTSRKHDHCDFFGDYNKFSKDDDLMFGQSFGSKSKDKPKNKTAAENYNDKDFNMCDNCKNNKCPYYDSDIDNYEKVCETDKPKSVSFNTPDSFDGCEDFDDDDDSYDEGDFVDYDED